MWISRLSIPASAAIDAAVPKSAITRSMSSSVAALGRAPIAVRMADGAKLGARFDAALATGPA